MTTHQNGKIRLSTKCVTKIVLENHTPKPCTNIEHQIINANTVHQTVHHDCTPRMCTKTTHEDRTPRLCIKSTYYTAHKNTPRPHTWTVHQHCAFKAHTRPHTKTVHQNCISRPHTKTAQQDHAPRPHPREAETLMCF